MNPFKSLRVFDENGKAAARVVQVALSELSAGEVVFQPVAYRGVLQKVDQANGAVVDWPWTDVAPGDFTAGANEFILSHTLTPAQVAALNIPQVEGGMLGLNLQKANQLYSLALRPLLPDETS